MSIIIIIIIT